MLLPYLALLQVGFAVPSLLPSPRCALTAPFHPYRPLAAFTVKGLGGLLSVALSVGSRPPGVTWHPIRRSPDFPPPKPLLAQGSDCPADSRGSRYGRVRRSQILAAFFPARAFPRPRTRCRGRPIRTRRALPARTPRRGWPRSAARRSPRLCRAAAPARAAPRCGVTALHPPRLWAQWRRAP